MSNAATNDRYRTPLQPNVRIAILILVLAPLLIVACTRSGKQGAPATVSVQVDTADGFRIHGTVYPSNHVKPPGLVLVHMLGSDRLEWQGFARKAQQAGFICVAYDMRGHGESTVQEGQSRPFPQISDSEWAAATADIKAAKQALVAQGADPSNLAVIGASLGANLALLYAHDDRDIQTVIMLSPGLDYKSIRTEPLIEDYPGRPVLLIASEGDTYSAKSCAVLKEAAPGYSELRGYTGSAHGTDLLITGQGVAEQILMWLEEILQPSNTYAIETNQVIALS
jgi:dienelactone hydrolase